MTVPSDVDGPECAAPYSDAPTPTLTEDAFLGTTLSVLQPKRGYRAGLDAVFLAATIDAPQSDTYRILDVGAGAGVVSLCIAARLAHVRVSLVEMQPDLIAIAAENIMRNGFADRLDVWAGDVLAGRMEAPFEEGLFDHVVSNPPFYELQAMRPSSERLKARSHALPAGGLEAWVRFMVRMTRPGGQVTLIHRAECLDELLTVMAKRFGGLIIQPLHARPGEVARRVVVRGTKGSRAPLRLLPGLILHGAGHTYRPEIDRVLRGPHGWVLGRANEQAGTGESGPD
jgi:tRNA1(Val) A37 N6-methylase TrmN6